MERLEREAYCRRAAASLGGDALPFVLPGAKATWAPDRVCDVKHIKVEVSLDFERRAVDGVCTQTVAPLNDGPTRLVLDAVEMTILQVTLADGESLEFEYDGKVLSFDLGERKQGDSFDVIIRYRCAPRRGLYFIAPDEAYPDAAAAVLDAGPGRGLALLVPLLRLIRTSKSTQRGGRRRCRRT